MSIRVITAPLTGGGSDELVFAAAGAAARQFDAHVDVVFQRADPRAAIPYLGEGVSGEVVSQFVENAEQQNAELALRTRDRYNAWRGSMGLELAEQPEAAPAASCSWRETDGLSEGGDGGFGLADLVIAARDGAGGMMDSDTAFERALMNSGRPVLLMSAQPGLKLGDNILVAWNGSAEAARALSAAMPFLQQAHQVTVASAAESRSFGQPPGEGVCRYLAWHGVEAEARSLPDDGNPVGETLLAEAAKCGADMLVMGAYGHSRLREFVLGGVTQYVLDEGTLPVLMMH